MTNMNLLKKLRAKEGTIVFPVDGEELTLKVRGLTFSETAELAELADSGKGQARVNGDISNFYLRLVLKYNFPEASDEELNEVLTTLDASTATKIIAKVSELSGWSTDETKKVLSEE